MKYKIIKDLKKAIVFLVVISSIVSCSMDEIYSCDKDINMWVKNNLTEIRQMSRADWIAVGNIDQQRAAYRAFTTNQMQALWIEKMQEVLKLDWSKQERTHIQSMLDIIRANGSVFSVERDQAAFDKVEVELYRWTEHAQEELGWDKVLLSAIVGTPQALNADKTINSNALTIQSPSVLKNGNEGGGYVCNCSYKSDFCFGGAFTWCSETNICETSNLGCGLLWLWECNGMCMTII